MLYSEVVCVVVFSMGVFASLAAKNGGGNGGGVALTLDTAAVQTGSASDGSNSIGAEAGQALSQTSSNNFINFCAGKTLTNGLQIVGGSCNGIVMGDIPAKTNMVSSIILNPQNGAQVASDTTFDITVQVAGLVAGSFTNADTTYYAGPQFLQGGNIVGHTHVTVQNLGNNLNPQTPPDPTQFAFFKGINDAGNGQGTLTATVTGGLPAGNYRVCTMVSASNHQPVLMPVAQRGSPDDCTKFTVTGSGTTINPAANNGANGEAAAALVAEAVVGATNSAFAAAVIASESAAATAPPAASTVGGNASGGKGGKGAKIAGGATVKDISAPPAATSPPATNTAAGAGGKAKGGGKVAGAAGGAEGKDTTSAPQAAASPPAANISASTTGKDKGGRGGARGGKLRFSKRQFVA